MEFGQQHPYGQGQGQAPIEAPDTARIQQHLERHLNDLSEISDRLSRVAGELFGPPPPSAVTQGGETARGQGAIDQIHGMLEQLHQRAQVLTDIAQRFNRLV